MSILIATPTEIVYETNEEFFQRVKKRAGEIDAGDRTPITHRTISREPDTPTVQGSREELK